MTVENFVGLRECVARKLAEVAGLTVVTTSTVVPVMLTNSMNMSRVTLSVHDGIVTAAKLG
jgi:hypothetical protein